MHKTQRAALAFIAVLSILVPLSNTAFASKGEDSKVEAKTEKSPSGSDAEVARFGTIPLSASTIGVVSESAKIVVKRVPEITEVVLFSNCPRNWALRGSMIRQAGFSGEVRKGTSLLADGLGSRAIVNGKVYMLPSGPMKGLSMGAAGVTIGGQPIDPLKGSDIPCNCSGDDLLEIHVPLSFTGDLKIGSAGKSKLQIDSWKDGGLECLMFGESTLSAGKLESQKLAFDNRGNGAADIGEVDAKIFVANCQGQGNAAIRVKKGKAEVSNATVQGNGTIELHGIFKGLRQDVQGTGKIEVKP